MVMRVRLGRLKGTQILWMEIRPRGRIWATDTRIKWRWLHCQHSVEYRMTWHSRRREDLLCPLKSMTAYRRHRVYKYLAYL